MVGGVTILISLGVVDGEEVGCDLDRLRRPKLKPHQMKLAWMAERMYSLRRMLGPERKPTMHKRSLILLGHVSLGSGRDEDCSWIRSE
jgi:hypothetical protein